MATTTYQPQQETRRAVRPSPIFFGIVALAVFGGALAYYADPSGSKGMRQAGVFILVLAGWVVSLCLHEFGHAIVAYLGGDYTVADKGYLTLDVRKYADRGLRSSCP